MNDVRIVLLMYPQNPPGKEMPAAFLKAFEDHPSFKPTHWGLSERKRKPYSRKDILAEVSPSDGEPSAIYLHRQKVIKYTGEFDFEELSFLNFDFGSITAARWLEILELADNVAAAVKPRFGTLHIFRATPDVWVTDIDRILIWMSFAAYPAPVDFASNGPLGVGMRTYFGHEILEMFGRDLLLSSPAQTQVLPWGGVRLDLAADMWNMGQEELAGQWKKVMDPLQPSQAIAEPVFEDDERTVSFRPSPAWRKWLKTLEDENA